MNHSNKDLILRLFDIDAIQFGEFQLRTGIMSPFYLDFRKIVSYPDLLKSISAELSRLVNNIPFDYICGVPYAALSFATGVAFTHDAPLVVKRKERKKHGTKKLVEGAFKQGDSCIVVEDIVTSGTSLLETIEALENEGLVVKDAVAIVDRKQGGTDILAQKGYTVHTIFDVFDVFDILLEAGKINQTQHKSCLQFVQDNVVSLQPAKKTPAQVYVPSYKERIEYAHHPISKRLLQIAEEKQTNLILSADVDTAAQLIEIVEQVGPHICMLKTHVDILPDFTQAAVEALVKLAKKHNFLLFEDRKYADIGNTARKQFTAKVFGTQRWADVVTVHVVAGASSVMALKDTDRLTEIGLIIIAQMSTSDTLTDESYMKKATTIGEENKDCVIGFVAQQKLTNDFGLLQFTPGIHLESKGDNRGQTYNTPAIAFSERGTDFIIVGRGIYQAENPLAAAKKYKEAGWNAYLNRN